MLQLLLWEVCITGVSVLHMSLHRWAFFVWQPPMSRGTKSTRWPSEPVEQNMTSDLAAFSLMAYRNSLKFMTRALMQVSKNRGADCQLACLTNHVEGHYDQVPAPTQILQWWGHVIKHDFNTPRQSCCLSLSEESKISFTCGFTPLWLWFHVVYFHNFVCLSYCLYIHTHIDDYIKATLINFHSPPCSPCLTHHQNFNFNYN